MSNAEYPEQTGPWADLVDHILPSEQPTNERRFTQ